MHPLQDRFTIRAATLKDVTVLSKIGAETFYHTFRPYNTEEDMQAYIGKTYNTQQVEANLGNNLIHYFLCDHSDQCIGYVKLVEKTGITELLKEAIELEKIYVHHHYFGTEAARLLMNIATDTAIRLGFKKIFLGVWEKNKRAVSFYLKNGFETVSTRQFKLGGTICDDYIMLKNLD